MTEILIGPPRDPAGTPQQRSKPQVRLPRQRGAAVTSVPAGFFAHGKVGAGTASIAICNWRDLAHPEGGGSELYVEQVAQGLAALGNQVTVLCAGVPGAPRDEIREGVHYRRRGGRFSVYLHAAAALAGRRVRPDVVVDVQNGLPWLSRLVTRKPVVVLVHHVHREQWPIAVGRLLGRIGWWTESRFAPRLYRGSRYVTVSESSRRELAGLGVAAERTAVVHNGMRSLPGPRRQRSVSPRIVVLGRLVPHKRVEITIQAVAQLRRRYPDLVLDVVGRGWWEPELRRLVADLGLDETVRFHGHVDEPTKADLLQQAWVHAAASVKEGWGLSVVEAASLGTPTVAFAGAGGLDESVVDGVTGTLVRGGEAEFAEALDRLLSDRQRRERMGAMAAAFAQRFTWQVTTERWIEVLDRAVSVGS